MKTCEILVYNLSHASFLKSDDFRLNGMTLVSEMCPNCDLEITRDIKHINMQYLLNACEIDILF